MLSRTQVSILEAFGHIIGNVDVSVSVTCFFQQNNVGYCVQVKDSSEMWVDIAGVGFTLDEAYQAAVAKCEGHPLGCSLEEVEHLLAEEGRFVVEDISGFVEENSYEDAREVSFTSTTSPPRVNWTHT